MVRLVTGKNFYQQFLTESSLGSDIFPGLLGISGQNFIQRGFLFVVQMDTFGIISVYQCVCVSLYLEGS